MNSNLSTTTRGTVGSSLSRPFADLWGFDPFRALSNSVSGIDISRTESGYTVEIPVAGFKPEDINVTLEDGIVNVSGKNDKRNFTRALSIPEDVDAERIEANVEHGMLTLTLPLQPKAQPKRIEIKAR